MSKIALQGNALGTGTFTIAAPNSNTDRTLTLPDAAGIIPIASSEGTSGQVLTSGGAGSPASWATPSGYAGSQFSIFTSNGTFTIPSGITKLIIYVIGAGGGYNSFNLANGGSGGGGISSLSGLTSGGTIAVVVGTAGGNSSTSSASGGGGSSSVSSGTQSITTITATGGAGVASGQAAGGSCSGAQYNFTANKSSTSSGVTTQAGFTFGTYGLGGIATGATNAQSGAVIFQY